MSAIDLRASLEAHAADCRAAQSKGRPRPDLPAHLRDLARANLAGADLGGANLAGADLGRVDGSPATVTAGPVRTVTGGAYSVLTAQTNRGRVLRFGCEIHTLVVWDECVGDLCRHHERDRAEEFEREIRALLAWCRSLDAQPAAKEAT